MRPSFARSSLLSVLLSAGTLSAQTTRHVPADYATIQEAILAAVNGDTVLVAPGTYVEELDYLGKAITLASESGAAATILSNVNSAVSFVNGEGAGSVLRGFTVTGNNSSRAAIHGEGASPRIVQCVIRGNQTGSALAAGVYCDGTLVDCVIEDNRGHNGTGGVAGALTLRRCVLRRNSGYDGAAALLRGGGRMEDCLVISNGSGEGSAGGAVSISSPYTVEVERCLFVDNWKDTWSGQYAANGAALTVQQFAAPARLVNCTIVANHVTVPGIYGPDHGGVHGPVLLENCIVRDNDGQEFQAVLTSATYSNLEGGLAGAGNFDLDPLFRDAVSGDWRLLAGSPCIDTGDPAAALDPDGTRADVGTLEFTHATAFVINGSGTNPLLLASVTPPALGTTWQATIQAALVSGTTTSWIQVRSSARPTPLATPFGELLISGPLLGLAQVPSNGSLDLFAFAIPPDATLLGLAVHAQGYVLQSPGGLRLGNGLRLLLGE